MYTRNKTINDAAWITICLVVVIVINALGAGKLWPLYSRLVVEADIENRHTSGAYGEAEFIFCSIKVVTIVGLIILGIILDLGGGPNHDRIGFRYWKHPGPFVQYDRIEGAKGRFLGWSAVMAQAAFSFIGTEVVAVRTELLSFPQRVRDVLTDEWNLLSMGVWAHRSQGPK